MKVLVATKSVAVLEALRAMKDVEFEPALFTDQIAKGIPTADLVIIDFEDIVEYPYEIGVIQSQLAEAQEKRRLPWAGSEAFLAAPEKLTQDATRTKGGTELPDKLTIAFTSYSGGVGKTTLALDTALHFARQTERPVMVVEFVHGVSALTAMTGLEMPHMFDLTSNVDLHPSVFKGVTLVPMDYDSCSVLPVEQLAKYLKKQVARHTLTVVDAIQPHGLIKAIEPEIDEWLVVTTPRLDAVGNASKLVAQLGAKASIVLNEKRGTADALALAGTERGLDLPHQDRVNQWEGKLGAAILQYVYGRAWKRYGKPEGIAGALKRLVGR